MLIHHEQEFSLYFGDAQDALYPAHYLSLDPHTLLLEQAPFTCLKKELSLSALFFLQQTHSTDGYNIDHQVIPPAFGWPGDYLITQSPYTGLGIMTADCLPIIIIDTKKKQLATIHAGWRGALAGIAQQTLASFDPMVVRIFFGPSARSCCYEVDQAFLDNIPASLHPLVTQQRNGTLFFNLPRYVSIMLEQAGVKARNINTTYNFCTMCDHRFFSHRRQGAKAGRQMTVATLR